MNKEKNETNTGEEEGEENPGALKFLSALKKKAEGNKGQAERGLMYVDAWVNQKEAKRGRFPPPMELLRQRPDVLELGQRPRKNERSKLSRLTHFGDCKTNEVQIGIVEWTDGFFGCEDGRF